MPVFPSEEWVKALEEISNQDPEYKKAGADWEGDMVVIIEAEPGLLEEDFVYYSKPHHGEILESGQIKSPDEKPDAEYVLSGPYSVFKAVIKGEADAMEMMMKGKVRLKGDMSKILRYAKFQQLGMQALSKVETRFIDEQ